MTSSRDIGRLLDIMAVLRTPQTGCPWDLAQDFSTIAPYTLEEAHEVADAIARGDLADLREELGDLLLQVVFHARMAAEQGAFDFGDVVVSITEKLIRRHPHVFGDERAHTPQAVEGLWERIKAREKEDKAARNGGNATEGALAGVPVTLPALTRALKLQAKASKVGFDWNDPRAVLRKIREEADEIEAAAPSVPPPLAGRVGWGRLPKSAICYLPRSIWRGICAPIRRRCCGQPTANSNAVSRQSSARLRHGESRRPNRRSPKWTRYGMRRRLRSKAIQLPSSRP